MSTSAKTALSWAITAAILFFGWSVRPALNHYGTPSRLNALYDTGGLLYFSALALEFMPMIIVAISIFMIASEFTPDTGEDNAGIVSSISPFAWSFLGWYCGRNYSTFGSSDWLWLNLYMIISVYLAIDTGVYLLRQISGHRTS